MKENKDNLLLNIRNGVDFTLRQKISLTMLLCAPAVVAQLAGVLLQFTDAAMVGSLGAAATAAIGLVSTTTWILHGFCMATAQGFSVQIAHLLGAGDAQGARKVLRQGLTSVMIFSLTLTVAGYLMAPYLPYWLGGGEDICADAARYFRIYVCFLPMMQLNMFGSTVLQCSGDMKTPSALNVLMLSLNVVFNFILIFPTREIVLGASVLSIYGVDLGVKGAAIGTGVAETIVAVLMMRRLLFVSKELAVSREKGSYLPEFQCLRKAVTITGPMWLQNIILRGAYIASTVLVAPLGAVAIAANSLAITAESFCYMPGYGMADAATTLIGQSLGAKRKDLAKSFSTITISSAMLMMGFLAVIMYIAAPAVMSLLTVDADVVSLGAKVLRIEAFAELGYAASIVAYGACVGAGDTMVPSVMNLGCMWVLRIGLALILTPKLGLEGYWIAMCIDLNLRGLIFLLRIRGTKWMKLKIV